MNKLKLSTDTATFRAMITACVLFYNKYLDRYDGKQPLSEGASATLAYQWAFENAEKTRPSNETEVKFKCSMAEGFAILQALDAFAHGHPLWLVLGQQLQEAIHKSLLASQSAYNSSKNQPLQLL